MRSKCFFPIILFLISTIVFCQEDKLDFKQFTKETLEFTALKPCFYLVCQEYVLIDKKHKSDPPKVRGGNDFYGKAYTIGVLGTGSKLWFPSYIRYPWAADKTYDPNSNRDFNPVSTFFKIKSFNDQDFFVSKLQPDIEKDLISFFYTQNDGILIDSVRPDNGTLVFFHSSRIFPNDLAEMSKSIIPLENINWDSENKAEIEYLNVGKDQIFGGALFSRYITPGKIEWRLSGFYLLIENKWVLKSTYDLNKSIPDK